MGSGISDNYTNITPTFNSRFWKVHSAVKKSTGEEVSLWLLDTKEIKNSSKSKNSCQKYIDSCIESVNKLRRLHHPNILQIYEVSDNPKQFGFSSERIEGTLESDKTLNADDITYVADQLSQALSFLHEAGKTLHLGICPDAICLTKAIKVKLCDLNYSTPFENDSEVKPSYGDFIEDDPLGPEICFTAPEYLEKKALSSAADIFSYGATLFAAYNKKGPVYVATTTEEVVVTVSAGAFKTPTNMNDPMHDLLLKCVNYDPKERPTLAEIAKSPAFFQLSIRSLRFLALLATKDLNDRLHFFQNIIKSLSLFSDRLLYHNLLPTFVNEVKANDMYGPVLIPVIFHIGLKLPTEDFMKEIIGPLSSTLKKCSPPALAIAILNVADVIIQKVPEDKQFELIYPIFINSLQSPSQELRLEAIKNIPVVISAMTENSILNSLLPTLLDFVSSFDDVEIVCSVIQCIEKCATKVNNDQFSFVIMPKLMICWVRLSNPMIADAIIDILENINSSITSKMKFVIPMATAIITTPHLPKETITRLGDLISTIIQKLRTERNLEERAATWRPAETSGKDEIQIQAPIKVDQIDQDKIEVSRRRSSVNEHSSGMSSGPGSLTQPSIISSMQQPQQQSLYSQASPQLPSNEESYGNVANSSIGNDPAETQEKKRSIKSFFGFGKKKNQDNIEEQSLAQPSYDTSSVAPRGGPPGPLPSSLGGPVGSAPRAPPGPPPLLPHQQQPQQQQSLYQQAQQTQSLYTQQPQQQSLYQQAQQTQSLYAQQQAQSPQQSLYANQPQSQPQQQSLYTQQQMPISSSTNYSSTGNLPTANQPPPQQQPSMFAGMNQGPAPKKPSQNQSLFSGLNMRTKK